MVVSTLYQGLLEREGCCIKNVFIGRDSVQSVIHCEWYIVQIFLGVVALAVHIQRGIIGLHVNFKLSTAEVKVNIKEID